MNPSEIGWPMVFVWFGMMLAFIAGLALGLVALDKRLGKKIQVKGEII